MVRLNDTNTSLTKVTQIDHKHKNSPTITIIGIIRIFEKNQRYEKTRHTNKSSKWNL